MFNCDLMKLQIAIGIALAAIIVTGIALANSEKYTTMQGMHESHHGNGNGMMGMMNMMNGNWEEMHEQCESSMTEEAHEQCENMMESGSCPMMQ